jgi:stage II sporulation protein D
VRRSALAALLLTAACVTKQLPDPGPPVVSAPVVRDTARRVPPRERTPTRDDFPRDEAPTRDAAGGRAVRVALAVAARAEPEIGATAAWRLTDARGGMLVRGRADEPWRLERRGRQLRAVDPRRGATTPWTDAGLTVRPEGDDAFVTVDGKRYRGAVRVIGTDTTLLYVNVLGVEAYLRGVVPLEIGGPRAPNEQAAVEAQAIAARSYTAVRLSGTARSADYDLLATVTDQVYGGADAERPFSDAAVAATAGLVITYNGRPVNAPYHSTCGGETAAPDEVWRSANEPWLRPVSDRIPGSASRSYCDIAPRFAWTRVYTETELEATLRRYLAQYASVPAGGPGRATRVTVDARTPSGRVGRLTIATDRGTFSLRGNDIRYVLRAPGGELLNSTYFSVDADTRPGGTIARLIVRGNGYGHGIGMCQWGAIGRSRAGQSARTILATYYPGTSIAPYD